MPYTINLLQETIMTLKHYRKSPHDVQWVGSKDGKYAISWEEFHKIAAATDYTPTSSFPQIASDLVVVGKDWWLERITCDGLEWWTFHTLPQKHHTPLPFSIVKSPLGPDTLGSIQPLAQSP